MLFRKNKPPKKSFVQWQKDNWEPDNIFPPTLDAQEAINFLQIYLLGEDWYTSMPVCAGQVNTEIVGEILYKYSKTYRKEFNKAVKEARQ